VSIRRIVRAVAATAALAGATTAVVPAAATPVVTGNACQYSYDGYWRDIAVTLDGTASRSSAARGDTITLTGTRVDASLPAWMAEYGFRFGLLREGENEIPATVWVAVQGANTEEGVRIFEVDATAHTTVNLDATGRPLPAPMVYDIPDLPDSTWTARGGEVTFGQAPAGTLPPIPAGPGGTTVVPVGSVYIQARLGAAVLGLDCLPGGYIADGAGHSNAVPDPFATVDVPAFVCIARRPEGTNASPVDVRIARLPVAGGPAAARTIAPALGYRIPNAYLDDLRAAGVIPTGSSTVRIAATAALDGTGTIEPRQVATGETPASVVLQAGAGGVAVGGQAGADLAGSIPLAATTWTPAAPAPMSVGVAPPGALGTLTPEGASQPVAPYGSVYLWVTVTPSGGGAVRVPLDCVSGGVAVADAGVAYSVLGNQPGGDRGRFAISGYTLAPFAVAPLDGAVPPVTPQPAQPVPQAPVASVRTRTPAPVRPTLTLRRSGRNAVLRVRASLGRARAGRIVAVERKVGRTVLRLTTVRVPTTGRIDRRITLRRGAATGAKGIRGARRLDVRLRILATARATAAAGRYRAIAIPRALR